MEDLMRCMDGPWTMKWLFLPALQVTPRRLAKYCTDNVAPQLTVLIDVYDLTFLAQFMYQRESRENPSLHSYIEEYSGQSEGHVEQLKPTKQLKSPLTTSSCSASAIATQDIG